MTQPPYSLQPYQTPRDGYAPPEVPVVPGSAGRPVVPLGRTLAWTAVVSTLGVALVVIVVGLVVMLVLLLLAFVYVFVAMLGIDPAELWDGGSLREIKDDSAGSVVLVIVLAALISFALTAGVLLLLRLSDSVRRWASFLQALTSCGIVYLSGGVLLGIVFIVGG